MINQSVMDTTVPVIDIARPVNHLAVPAVIMDRSGCFARRMCDAAGTTRFVHVGYNIWKMHPTHVECHVPLADTCTLHDHMFLFDGYYSLTIDRTNDGDWTRRLTLLRSREAEPLGGQVGKRAYECLHAPALFPAFLGRAHLVQLRRGQAGRLADQHSELVVS